MAGNVFQRLGLPSPLRQAEVHLAGAGCAERERWQRLTSATDDREHRA